MATSETMNIDTRQEYAIVNGKVILSEDAKISVYDGSIQFGYGIFETLRTYRGVFFAWEKHYQRLVKGCQAMHMKVPFNHEESLQQLQKLRDTYLADGHLDDAVYRITITPGKVENWHTDLSNTVIITRRPLSNKLFMLQEQGINLAILETKRLPSTTNERIKATQFADIVIARNELRAIVSKFDTDFFDGLMCNEQGMVVESTCSNIFVVIEEGQESVLLTPSMVQQPLAGITRQYILEIAKDEDIKTIEASIDINTLRQAKEIFITNSVHEIVPVKKVMHQSNVIFDNCGQFQIARNLLQAYKNIVHVKI